MTNLDEYIMAHADDEYDFVDEDYRSGECAGCRRIFAGDDELLAHLCDKEVKEY